MSATVVDDDAVVLRDLGDTVTMIDVKYRLATPADRLVLKPERDRALEEYARAREALLADGVLCNSSHIAAMRRIQVEIEQAADRQRLVEGIVKLVGFMRRLV